MATSGGAAGTVVPKMRVKRKAVVKSSGLSTAEKLNRIFQGRSVIQRWLSDFAPDGGIHSLSTASDEQLDCILAFQKQMILQLKAEKEAKKPPGVGANRNTSMSRSAALVGTNAHFHAGTNPCEQAEPVKGKVVTGI